MNAARGETRLAIDGVPRRLCLTLGALAEIEAAFACTRMSELSARLRTVTAADLIVVVAALLRGAGEVAAAERLGTADIAPGEAATAVAEAFRLGLGQ